MAWVAYAVLMLVVYPVGVITLYASLLFKNRERIKKPEKEREEDEGLQSLAFLYDSYETQYWWFEVFETARRLAMTGVLGAISPGSTLQLGAGILMTVIGLCVYCLCMPYIEIKDDILGVMTNFQIFLVMLTALVMKVGGGEGTGVGIFLMVLNALAGVVLVGFGCMQVYSVYRDGVAGNRSSSSLAMGVLGGKKEHGDVIEVEMKENPLRGYDSEAGEKPVFSKSSGRQVANVNQREAFQATNTLGGEDEIRQRAQTVSRDRMSSYEQYKKPTRGGGKKKVREEPEGGRVNDVWDKIYDDAHKMHYYQHNETGESVWERPTGYVDVE